ncbi:MAG: hypothetical protein GY757_45750 [bacterium]|nr:hypothetical protein [bacterium]
MTNFSPVLPDSIAKKYSFGGDDLKEYQEFIGKLINIYDEHYGGQMDRAILPEEDKELFIKIFNYHVNNVGNPDGKCRYGLETRGFELALLNNVFSYLNMPPYGGPPTTNSFGYFTLGHKEAAIFAIKAAKTRFEKENTQASFLGFGKIPLSVVEAAFLLKVPIEAPIIEDVPQFKDYISRYQKENPWKGIILTLHIPTDEKDDRKLREIIKATRQVFPGNAHIHLTGGSIRDIHALFQKENPFVPSPSSLIYVDTISISEVCDTKSRKSSYLSGVILTTAAVQDNFNSATVPYIGAEDSTVVGSRNGDFLLLDDYFHKRFPFDEMETLISLSYENMIDYMKNNAITAEHAQEYGGFEYKLRRLKKVSMGYPCNQLWENPELDNLFELLLKENIMYNTKNNIFSADLRLSQVKKDNDIPYTEIFSEKVLTFYKEEVFFQKETAADFDGYITTGGTEGNYIGLYIAAQLFGKDAVLFLTPQAHYSISKGAAIFDLDTEKVKVDDTGGHMRIDSLKEAIQLRLKKNPNLSVVIGATLGTTMKGAIDSIKDINDVLNQCGISQEKRYIHCDAALHGHILPFLDKTKADTVPFSLPPGDPRYIPIDSISVSGHKFVGAPFPCGIGLFRKANLDNVKGVILDRLRYAISNADSLYDNQDIEEYFDLSGTITTGSKNEYMTLVIWKRICELGRNGLAEFAQNCIAVAQYAIEKIEAVSATTHVKPFRNKNSNIITLSPPPPLVVLDKWGLPIEEGVSHLDIMPHVSTGMIDSFVNDLLRTTTTNSE